jgi:hypothetical protein
MLTPALRLTTQAEFTEGNFRRLQQKVLDLAGEQERVATIAQSNSTALAQLLSRTARSTSTIAQSKK